MLTKDISKVKRLHSCVLCPILVNADESWRFPTLLAFFSLCSPLDDDEVVLNMCKLQGSERLEEVLCELIDCRVPEGGAWSRQYALSPMEQRHKRGSINFCNWLKRNYIFMRKRKVDLSTYLSPGVTRNTWTSLAPSLSSHSFIFLYVAFPITLCFLLFSSPFLSNENPHLSIPRSSSSCSAPLLFLPLSHLCLCLPSCLTHYSPSSPFPSWAQNEAHFTAGLIVRLKNENMRHWGTQSRLLTVMGLWGGGLNIKITEGEMQNVKWTSEQKASNALSELEVLPALCSDWYRMHGRWQGKQ